MIISKCVFKKWDTRKRERSICYRIRLNVWIFRFFIPVVFYANEGRWVRQNTTVVGSSTGPLEIKCVYVFSIILLIVMT
jgi:hypothetical protein